MIHYIESCGLLMAVGIMVCFALVMKMIEASAVESDCLMYIKIVLAGVATVTLLLIAVFVYMVDMQLASRREKKMLKVEWIFAVDTNVFPGGFEREMCAYMTGRLGECEVGSEAAAEYRRDMGDLTDDDETFCWVENRADDHGVMRPVSVWPTPGWHNVGGVVSEGDPESGQHPAYLSVAIFMSRAPTTEEIEFLKERATKFVEEDHSRFGLPPELKITGFRLIEERTTQSERKL